MAKTAKHTRKATTRSEHQKKWQRKSEKARAHRTAWRGQRMYHEKRINGVSSGIEIVAKNRQARTAWRGEES